MLMLPSPSRWTIVPPNALVMALERAPVPLALLEREPLVRLHQRRVPGHVGEHHRNKATVEALNHGAICRYRDP